MQQGASETAQHPVFSAEWPFQMGVTLDSRSTAMPLSFRAWQYFYHLQLRPFEKVHFTLKIGY